MTPYSPPQGAAKMDDLLREALVYVQKKHFHIGTYVDGKLTEASCTRCALAARIQQRLDTGGWIKVEDRLPEVEIIPIDGEDEECDFVPVLFVADGQVCAGRFWPAFSRKDKNVFISLQGRVYQKSDVTHWQPLPDLPRGE